MITSRALRIDIDKHNLCINKPHSKLDKSGRLTDDHPVFVQPETVEEPILADKEVNCEAIEQVSVTEEVVVLPEVVKHEVTRVDDELQALKTKKRRKVSGN